MPLVGGVSLFNINHACTPQGKNKPKIEFGDQLLLINRPFNRTMFY